MDTHPSFPTSSPAFVVNSFPEHSYSDLSEWKHKVTIICIYPKHLQLLQMLIGHLYFFENFLLSAKTHFLIRFFFPSMFSLLNSFYILDTILLQIHIWQDFILLCRLLLLLNVNFLLCRKDFKFMRSHLLNNSLASYQSSICLHLELWSLLFLVVISEF